MFYTAQHPQTGNIWDTWLVLHKGTYYLYYLAACGEQWDNTSMATSKDGVHWDEIGPILVKRPEATWMGTGSTWASPTIAEDGKFQINYSEWTGPRQTILFAESTDLIHWTKLSDDTEFVQDERWYHPEGRWDCIWTIERPGGGLYGYWTATPNDETGGQFGFGQSTDGVTWEALKPPVVHGVTEPGGEVGAIEKIGDRYVMMFGLNGAMVTLLADAPEGPFHLAEVNPKILGGNTYFARFFWIGDQLMANHHSIPQDREVHMGLLKRVDVDDAGAIRLAYWPGNDVLKGRSVDVAGPADAGAAIAMLETTFDAEGGFVLEGDLALPVAGGTPRGLYFECQGGEGGAVLFAADGSAEIGVMAPDGKFEKTSGADPEMTYGHPARFRLMAQHSLMELYLDEILIECFSLKSAATGRIGLITGGDAGAIGKLKAWAVS